MTESDQYAAQLGLEFTPAPKPPTFRFTARQWRPGDYKFEIHPYGFTSLRLQDLVEAQDYAVGEVHAIDNDHAVALFAQGSGKMREFARRELHKWARKDRWSLTIERGNHLLSEPDPPVATHWTPGICRKCRDYWGTGYASHMRYKFEGWQHTYCYGCDGRWVWWSKSKRDIPTE